MYACIIRNNYIQDFCTHIHTPYTHTHNMRHTHNHTAQTYQSADVGSLSDGGRNIWFEQSLGVQQYIIDDIILAHRFIYSSIYIYRQIYLCYGESSPYMYMRFGIGKDNVYMRQSNWWKCLQTAFQCARYSLQRQQRSGSGRVIENQKRATRFSTCPIGSPDGSRSALVNSVV